MVKLDTYYAMSPLGVKFDFFPPDQWSDKPLHRVKMDNQKDDLLIGCGPTAETALDMAVKRVEGLLEKLKAEQAKGAGR